MPSEGPEGEALKLSGVEGKIEFRNVGFKYPGAPERAIDGLVPTTTDRSNPGTHMLEHTHSGTELTCVLRGSFSHEGGRFGPGDFDFGDETLDHQPIVGDSEPCLCLVAMTGDLRMNGFFGRLISPFVRL